MVVAHLYVLSVGSNRPARQGRTPTAMLRAGIAALREDGVEIVAVTPPHQSAPIGPAQRRFANALAVVRTALPPPGLLHLVKAIERRLGRRSARRWGDRPIDIDIILWSGGIWHDAALTIPHAGWRERRFVLQPAVQLIPDWRDPVTGLTPRHLLARLRR